MEEVTYQGLTFEPYIRREQIAGQVQRLAQEIKRDYQPCVQYPMLSNYLLTPNLRVGPPDPQTTDCLVSNCT